MTATTQPTFKRRLTVEDLVRELLVSYRPDGMPPGHVCSERCTHTRWGNRALLDRLAELAVPGQQLLPSGEDAGISGKGARRGSPAPWSAPAAELLDEILRGALELNESGRRLLGWDELTVPRPAYEHRGPVRWGPSPAGGIGPRQQLPGDVVRRQPAAAVPAAKVDVSVAGRVALRGLPGILTALQREAPDRRLTAGPPDKHGVARPGFIEQAVQTWHRRATQVTGDVTPWHRLPSVLNPDHWSQQPGQVTVVRWLHGPRCADPERCGHESCTSLSYFRARRTQRWRPRSRFEGPACERLRCEHESCFRLRSRRDRWLPWRCPLCRADSLRMDAVTRLVHCLRPACGESWSASVFEVGSADPWGDSPWA